jgi:hypothetical protein
MFFCVYKEEYGDFLESHQNKFAIERSAKFFRLLIGGLSSPLGHPPTGGDRIPPESSLQNF